MDKQMFLNILENKFSDLQIPKDEIEKHIADMEKFLNTVSDEEFASEDPTEEEIAEIAENVVQRAKAIKAKREKVLQAETVVMDPVLEEVPEVQAEDTAEYKEEESFLETVENESETAEVLAQTPEEKEPEEIKEEVSQETAEEIPEETPEETVEEQEEEETEDEELTDVLELLAKEAQDERKDKETFEELKRLAIERAIAEQDEIIVNLVEETNEEPPVEENDPIEDIVDPAVRPDIAFEEVEAIKKEETKPEAIVEPEEIKEEKANTEEDVSYTINDADDFLVEEEDIIPAEDNGEEYELKPIKRKKKREKVKGSPLFWALFILTLPITLPLLIDIAALFGVVYVAVTALIVLCSVAMIACVAVGTALALIGIIYGAIECINVPVLGIFEIGLGVALGGATILVSVLLYNIAIRYLPMLYKYITRFAKFVIEKLADLFYKIKKECGKK